MPAEPLPDVLQDVTLRWVRTSGAAVHAPTRVLDLETRDDATTYVVVACPADTDPHEHHFEAELAWTHPLGRVSCPVSAHPGRRPYGAVWVLTPAGPPRRLQERRHFRAPMALPVRITWPEPGAEEQGGRHSDGTTVDVSEGGLLALLRGAAPEVGASVETTVVVDGEELSSTATVVRHVGFPAGVGVATAFPDPAPHADRLRRAAFEAERRRARGRD
jgi:hypothetical protein